jgi:hypothetical protein
VIVQVGDHAAAEWMIADRVYGADRKRDALKDKAIRACIPGQTSCGKVVGDARQRYRRRN